MNGPSISFSQMALRRAVVALLIITGFEVSEGAWTYPPMQISEATNNNGLPTQILRISSDNDNVKSYLLRGEGVGDDSTNPDNKFHIVPNTGWIVQMNFLDRETKSQYLVTASALDAAGNQVESDVDVTISVLDQNDNKPVFIESTLTGSVAEMNGTGLSYFMTVGVTDEDTGLYGVDGVSYSIESGSDVPSSSAPRFSIDSATGQVSVIGELDYETEPRVYFRVVARDGGSGPGFFTTSSVTVNVLDSNDHAPKIDDTPPKSVSELFPLNVTLYDISATDVDQGVNKEVYFEIFSGNTGDTFTIDSAPSDAGRSYGYIKLRRELDFEAGETSFTLKVKAYNKLASNKDVDEMATFRDIKITVTDGNEPPEFQNTPYSTVVSEATEPTFTLGVPVSTIDYDFGRNQTVTYSIADDPEGWFEIDSGNGEITAIHKLDREASHVKNGIYTLTIAATDNYPGNPASQNGRVTISITDVNDNPPSPNWENDEDSTVKICETPKNTTVTLISAVDPDDNSIGNGPPFSFAFDSSVDSSEWALETESISSEYVVTFVKDFNLNGEPQVYELPFTIADSGSPTQTGTYTLTVSVCSCSDDGLPSCGSSEVIGAGFPVAIVIAILVVVLLVIVLLLAGVAYKRRKDAQGLKEPFFDDEDDVRENLQYYQEEGGEEDQEAYDLSALRAPLMEPHAPLRIEKPLETAPQPRMARGPVPDDIGDYIGDAKDQADNDPSAPPFDSLLVFDYEGLGSDAGSLSSINTATTDGSMDYDYLNDWGPRFKKLADMYTGGSDTE